MLESPRSRGGALVLLGVALFALMVWYGSLGPGAYASQEYFGPDPDAYLGERVVVGGGVVDTDPVRIRVTWGTDGSAEYLVTGLDVPVERGELLRVAGRLTGPRTIHAESAFTVTDVGSRYAFGISFLAGLWVLARIIRHWRFDPETAALIPRTRSRTSATTDASDPSVATPDSDDPAPEGGDRDA
ncbi:hypothetical protein BRD00_07010 [Halobacteriales archaeon QS_8_69_26]|nr:MAG: hypothetical protein BRD00_07010 [Halobacteriales archaeon QS_8_69_26]